MSSAWVQVRTLQQHVPVPDHPPFLMGVRGAPSAQEETGEPHSGNTHQTVGAEGYPER